MVKENPPKNAFYTVIEGEVPDLVEKFRDFCDDFYGDRCEIYRVSIERGKSDGSAWKVHEFQSLDSRAVKAVENHLNARRDLVRIFLGSSAQEYDLEFIVCHARNTAALSRFVKKEHLDGLEEDDLVALAVENHPEAVGDVKEFLEGLE